jgi:hypothetical protein
MGWEGRGTSHALALPPTEPHTLVVTGQPAPRRKGGEEGHVLQPPIHVALMRLQEGNDTVRV